MRTGLISALLLCGVATQAFAQQWELPGHTALGDDGTVGEVTLLDSSTHEVLDTAALDTIRSLPRMPLPSDVPARPLRIRIPVVFQMR